METLHNWLAIASVGLSGQRYLQLSEHMSLAELLALPASTLQQIGLTQRQAQLLCYEASAWVEQALQWQAEAADHAIIPFDHPLYPPLLKETRQPPLVLFVKGDAELLRQPQIAMVGSRSPSPTGRKVARQLAAELTQSGMLVTSGMAQGIDSECHLGALQAGGKTIAVINSTLDLCSKQLLDNLDEQPIPADLLAERVGITVTDVSITLLELELAGKVAVVPGGYIRVRST
ncbi:DNA-processing protein DprA [Alishewanella longhuensis]